MADAATQARELIRIVRDDPGLPPQVHRRASQLTGVSASDPDLALELLEELHQDTVPDLHMTTPTTEYARFLGLETFWRFNLNLDIKRRFSSYEVYHLFIEKASDPADHLADHLGVHEIAPAIHSWLIPTHKVSGLTGKQAQTLLNFDQQPPYVVMVFSIAKMKAVGMKVREPRGIDAIPKRLIRWHPGDVPDERIDNDIPRSALERIEWRP